MSGEEDRGLIVPSKREHTEAENALTEELKSVLTTRGDRRSFVEPKTRGRRLISQSPRPC